MGAQVNELIQLLRASLDESLRVLAVLSEAELDDPSEHPCAMGGVVRDLLTHNIDHERMHVGQVFSARYSLRQMQTSEVDRLTVDTVRRRIISAQGQRLACYHAEDRVLDVLSDVHPPARWLSLDVDPHTRQLWALGKIGSELVLYVSEDWGNTIWEAGRVTAKSGIVIADPVRGVVVVYYEDASGDVQQLLRLPDGSTVGPTPVQLSGAALTARVLGGDTDEFSAGRHLLKVRQAGVVKVIAGQDLLTATFEPWIV